VRASSRSRWDECAASSRSGDTKCRAVTGAAGMRTTLVSSAYRAPTGPWKSWGWGVHTPWTPLAMEKLHIVSPVVAAPEVSRRLGRPVLLKLDNLQPSGSFKIRGVGYLAQKVCEKRYLLHHGQC
jgi:hypothetical protein